MRRYTYDTTKVNFSEDVVTNVLVSFILFIIASFRSRQYLSAIATFRHICNKHNMKNVQTFVFIAVLILTRFTVFAVMLSTANALVRICRVAFVTCSVVLARIAAACKIVCTHTIFGVHVVFQSSTVGRRRPVR